MSKSAEDYIPHEIQRAGKVANQTLPIWYVGRSNGHENKQPKTGIKAIVVNARKAAGHAAPRMVKPSPRSSGK